MNYFAEFRKGPGGDFRIDTRVYLDEISSVSDEDSPIGAIVAKNPGSARPNPAFGYDKLAPLTLNGDNMLPTVRSVFLQARNQARKLGRRPAGNYVQVLNLSYFCNPDLGAFRAWVKGGGSGIICPHEKRAYQVVWYAWGPADPLLDPLKERFASLKPRNAIFFDKNAREVRTRRPLCPSDFVKHPQGMPHQPFVENLALLL